MAVSMPSLLAELYRHEQEVECQLERVRAFERSHPNIMSCVISTPTFNQGDWEFEGWQVEHNTLYLKLRFYWLQKGNGRLIPVSPDWADQQIASYHREHGQQQSQDKSVEHSATEHLPDIEMA